MRFVQVCSRYFIFKYIYVYYIFMYIHDFRCHLISSYVMLYYLTFFIYFISFKLFSWIFRYGSSFFFIMAGHLSLIWDFYKGTEGCSDWALLSFGNISNIISTDELIVLNSLCYINSKYNHCLWNSSLKVFIRETCYFTGIVLPEFKCTIIMLNRMWY